MKNIDLTKVDNLEALRDNFNNVINEHISRAKNKLAVSNIDSNNVGEMKYIFENISENLYNNPEGKCVIKKYVKTVKENTSLKNFYTLFETIKNINGVNDSSVFLNEAVKLSKKISKSEENKLRNVIKEGVRISNISDGELKTLMENYTSNIDKEISTILLEKCTPKNVLA